MNDLADDPTIHILNGYEIYPDSDDECIAREDDARDGYYGGGRCTCGREAAYREFDARDGFDYHDFPGCSGCDPVMHDCRPYKFGIELFEDEGRCAAIRGCRGCLIPGLLRERDMWAIVAKSTTVSLRRERAADLVWDRIVATAETHHEAVARYTRWAKRTVTLRYRDERKGGDR